MSDATLFAQLQPFTLAGSGTVIGASTIVLTTFAQIDGTLLTISNFGTKGFGTLDPGNGTREEQISFSGVVQNANGTATLTGVKTVAFVSPYTETPNLAKSHAGGSTFVISNTAGFYNELSGKDNDETITGKWTFPGGGNANAPVSGTVYVAPTDNLEYAAKKYVDDIAIAGAPNATTTVKGIVQVSTDAATLAGTDIGSTGAQNVIKPSQYITNKMYILDNSIPWGETITQGQVLYFDTVSSKWLKASAATLAQAQAYLVMAFENGVLGEFKKILGPGSKFYTNGLTQGAKYYLSDTAGNLSLTPGTNQRYIGQAISTTVFLFNPDEQQVTPVATANAVVQANGSGKIADGYQSVSAAQGAILTGGVSSYADTLHTHQIQWPQYLSSDGGAEGFLTQVTSAIASNAVLFATGISSGNTPFVFRFARQLSGKFLFTHKVTSTGGVPTVNNGATGCATIGSFVYVCQISAAGPTYQLFRLSATDLSGITTMTINGGTPGTGAAPYAYTDGTDLYLSNGASTQWKRYSISGTTATFVSNTAITQNGPAWCDGTNLYISSSANALQKYTLPATLVSTTTHNLQFVNPLATPQMGGVVMGNTGLLYVSTTGTVHSNTVLDHYATYLTPIDKP